jgi:predicted nucleotidyltransferase
MQVGTFAGRIAAGIIQIQGGIMHPSIRSRQAAIADLCRRYPVQRLEVFGSAARAADFAVGSDADFLVEFSPSAENHSLTDFFAFQSDLAQILGRAVDLAEASALRNPYLRASIYQSCEAVYAA